MGGALWFEGKRNFGPFRANLGFRFDAIGASVSSDNPLNSGHVSDTLVSLN